jgi:hypothetical protein
MDITKTLTSLRSERDRIVRAILALEELVAEPKRRGRPPKYTSQVRTSRTGDEKPMDSLKTA